MDTETQNYVTGMERDLNDKQERKLDRIAEADPEARVTGWHDGHAGRGPIVRSSGGRLAVINHTGYARNL